MNSQGDRKVQVQELLTKAERYLHRMFLAGCIFGALACFGRADFNLPLYAFLYIMWDQDDVSYFHHPTNERHTSLTAKMCHPIVLLSFN